MVGGWICVSIDLKVMRQPNAPSLIKKEMQYVFGSDFCEVVVVGDVLSGDCFESGAENYVFIKCRDYFSHKEELKKSKMVFGILDSYDEPAFCDESEIVKFIHNIEPDSKVFRFGDLVLIRKGCLKSLYGVVVDRVERFKYMVFFSLFSKKFCVKLNCANFDYKKNIVDEMRIPVIFDKGKVKDGSFKMKKNCINKRAYKILFEDKHEDNLRRRRNRKCK